jgi:hypothetical protein
MAHLGNREDLHGIQQFAHTTILQQAFLRNVGLSLYDLDYQKPDIPLAAADLLRHRPLFENVIEVQIQTFTSRDDPSLARFLSLLPVLRTLHLVYCADQFKQQGECESTAASIRV